MEIVSLADAPGYDSNAVVAQPLLEGSQCNVRIIRLSLARLFLRTLTGCPIS